MPRLSLTAAILLVAALPVAAQDTPSAMASFIGVDGAELGSVTLTQGNSSVAITGDIMGIPAGDHGFHFHETGDCDGADNFESAGAHFNPTDHQHGLENPRGPHAGDLPNLSVTSDTTTAITLDSDLISLAEGDPAYVFDADGTALVIHASADDNVTDPSGDSGDRIACAVIEANTAP